MLNFLKFIINVKKKRKALAPLGLHFQMATSGQSQAAAAFWTTRPLFNLPIPIAPLGQPDPQSFSFPVWLLKAFESVASYPHPVLVSGPGENDNALPCSQVASLTCVVQDNGH